MKKYYLNNVTDKEISISLSTKRKVKPFSSLSLNTKDLEIYRSLKRQRAGKPSLLDGLILSTIKLEHDANFINLKAKKSSNKKVEEKMKKESEAKAEAKAKAEAEAKAKAEAEAKAKAEAEAKAKAEMEANIEAEK